MNSLVHIGATKGSAKTVLKALITLMKEAKKYGCSTDAVLTTAFNVVGKHFDVSEVSFSDCKFTIKGKGAK
jgi:hypothetical protein